MKRGYLSICILLPLAFLAGCASNQLNQSSKAVTSIAFSPDGHLLAHANAHEIRVVEIETRKQISTLRELPQNAEGSDPHLFRNGVGDSMVFLDNSRIASTGMGGLVSVWDVSSGQRLSVIDPLPEEEFASTIEYSQTTKQLAIGTSTGRILFSSLENGDPDLLEPISELGAYVWDLQFSRDGRYVASASQMPSNSVTNDPADESIDEWTSAGFGQTSGDATIGWVNEEPAPSNVVIWDTEQEEMLGTLEGATGVIEMELVPGETALLTAGEDVLIWEFLTLKQFEEISNPSMALQAIGVGTMVAVSVVGLAAGGVTGMSFGESLLMGGIPPIPSARFIRQACYRAATISPDGRTIVTTTRGPSHNVMAVIDRAENKVIDKWTADRSVCDLEFSPNGKHLVAATSRGVYVFDTATWKKTHQF